MNAKIKKINAEYEKNAAKIAELQARQKELDKQRIDVKQSITATKLARIQDLDFFIAGFLLLRHGRGHLAVFAGPLMWGYMWGTE